MSPSIWRQMASVYHRINSRCVKCLLNSINCSTNTTLEIIDCFKISSVNLALQESPEPEVQRRKIWRISRPWKSAFLEINRLGNCEFKNCKVWRAVWGLPPSCWKIVEEIFRFAFSWGMRNVFNIRQYVSEVTLLSKKYGPTWKCFVNPNRTICVLGKLVVLKQAAGWHGGLMLYQTRQFCLWIFGLKSNTASSENKMFSRKASCLDFSTNISQKTILSSIDLSLNMRQSFILKGVIFRSDFRTMWTFDLDIDPKRDASDRQLLLFSLTYSMWFWWRPLHIQIASFQEGVNHPFHFHITRCIFLSFNILWCAELSDSSCNWFIVLKIKLYVTDFIVSLKFGSHCQTETWKWAV